jgi:hypothetical protein
VLVTAKQTKVLLPEPDIHIQPQQLLVSQVHHEVMPAVSCNAGVVDAEAELEE